MCWACRLSGDVGWPCFVFVHCACVCACCVFWAVIFVCDCACRARATNEAGRSAAVFIVLWRGMRF